MTLTDLSVGKKAYIHSIDINCPERKRLLDMGLTPGTPVKTTKIAPLGDPIEISIRGYSLILRKEQATKIALTNAVRPEIAFAQKEKKFSSRTNFAKKTFYPPLNYTDIPIDDTLNSFDRSLNFALIGNPNCGKTTLFNYLTDSQERIGNFPGVTIEAKTKHLTNHSNISIIDLPGLYSLTTRSKEETITKKMLTDRSINCVINIIEASNLERSFFLTLQLLEMGLPIVIALNMVDLLQQNHGFINADLLEKIIGIPVIPISARTGKSVDQLIKTACVIEKQDLISSASFLYHNDLYSQIQKARILLTAQSNHSSTSHSLLIDDLIENYYNSSNSKKLSFETDKKIKPLQSSFPFDFQTSIATMRYSAIERICEKVFQRPTDKMSLTSKIDSVITHKLMAIPILTLIVFTIFQLTFNLIGGNLTKILTSTLNHSTECIKHYLEQLDIDATLTSLICDAILPGIINVISFLPIILTLFTIILLLEESGYSARIAFIMDRPMSKIGLSGKSFIPIMLGFGCSVPAIMATRTLSTKKERFLTILLVPFLPCSAKIPVFSAFANTFFPENSTTIIGLFYLFGILIGVIFNRIAQYNNKFDKNSFILELPDYRIPSIRTTLFLILEDAKSFIKKLFTIIFICTILVWFMQNFNFQLKIITDSSQSIIRIVGNFFAPLLAPLGLDNWQSAVALIVGITAKESIISTFSVLSGANIPLNIYLKSIFTPVSAISFTTFALLYIPCITTLGAIHKELESWKATFTIICIQTSIAWSVAFITYNICSIFSTRM